MLNINNKKDPEKKHRLGTVNMVNMALNWRALKHLTLPTKTLFLIWFTAHKWSWFVNFVSQICSYLKNLSVRLCFVNTNGWNSYSQMLLSDFINLTQVHNFTVSAQDIFTFRRLSVFTVSFTAILQLLMQIMKRFVPSY